MNAKSNASTLAVIGAGPCGIGVGLAARNAGIDCVLFDKGSVASSIGLYPTWLSFFSTAERLELADIPFTIAGDRPTRREALRYYQTLAHRYQLDVRQYHDVTSVAANAGHFTLHTRTHTGIAASHDANSIVIATGYFDGPNRLHVPGDDMPKLRYGYAEAYPFYDQNCIVVGGGNSAVDAALELYRWHARVTLVHFEEGLDKGVKPWVLPDITNRLANHEIHARFRTRLAEIRPQSVVLLNEVDGTLDEVANDWVIAMTGYTPDPAMLRDLGVEIHPVSAIPAHDPATMQTNVPGVFIAGVVCAGQDANKVFIENGRNHGERIVDFLRTRS
jgi:thioredoxin reductase (NADPH)